MGLGGVLKVNAVEGGDDDGEDELEGADNSAGDEARGTTHMPVLI